MRKFASAVVLALILAGCTSASTKSANSAAIISDCNFIVSSDHNQLPDLGLPCLTATGYSKDQTLLKSLKGPLVLNLWGSWCAPCKEEMPLFRRLYLATKATKSLSIVGIDVEESSYKDGLNFMQAQGMQWPQLADNTEVTRADFGMGVPVTWFIDAKGAVTFKQVGQIHSWTQMLDLIRNHLGIRIKS